MKDFTDNLNELLRENKVTRYHLAKSLGINKQTVAFWCYGSSEPTATNLRKIAEFFDVTTDYLVGLEDPAGAKKSRSF